MGAKPKWGCAQEYTERERERRTERERERERKGTRENGKGHENEEIARTRLSSAPRSKRDATSFIAPPPQMACPAQVSGQGLLIYEAGSVLEVNCADCRALLGMGLEVSKPPLVGKVWTFCGWRPDPPGLLTRYKCQGLSDKQKEACTCHSQPLPTPTSPNLLASNRMCPAGGCAFPRTTFSNWRGRPMPTTMASTRCKTSMKAMMTKLSSFVGVSLQSCFHFADKRHKDCAQAV